MSKKKTSPISDKDFDCVIICAMRYALGRQSYMPSVIAGYIKNNIASIPDNAISVMIRDIEEAEAAPGYENYNFNALGDKKIDAPMWLDLKRFLINEFNFRKNI